MLEVVQNEGLAQPVARLEPVAESLGRMSGWRWREDPKGLLFTLARYKHVSKLLEGKRKVLEVGCADGFGSRIVCQHVDHLTAIDCDYSMIEDAKRRANDAWPINFRLHDIIDGGPLQGFDAAYALDVYEHIDPDRAPLFLGNMAASAPVVLIGCPSIESQAYASRRSKEGHINCRTAASLRASMGVWFKHVFMFGIQDETLHTGFDAMRHYLLALGVK